MDPRVVMVRLAASAGTTMEKSVCEWSAPDTGADGTPFESTVVAEEFDEAGGVFVVLIDALACTVGADFFLKTVFTCMPDAPHVLEEYGNVPTRFDPFHTQSVLPLKVAKFELVLQRPGLAVAEGWAITS